VVEPPGLPASVTVKVPVELKVCILKSPEVTIDPPVAATKATFVVPLNVPILICPDDATEPPGPEVPGGTKPPPA
jgi:hypothetical protein